MHWRLIQKIMELHRAFGYADEQFEIENILDW